MGYAPRRSSLRNFARCRQGPRPNDVEGNGEKPETQGISHDSARLRREAQDLEDIDGRPSEGEPADEQGKAPMPELCRGSAYRDQAEPLRPLLCGTIGCEEKAARHQDQSQHDGSKKISNHHLPEERRPIESQEGSDAPDGKDRDVGQVENETQGNRVQALGGSGHWPGRNPLPRWTGHPSKEPLSPCSQSEKPDDEEQHGERPSPLDFVDKATGGIPELVRQSRHGSGQGLKALPQARDPLHHHLRHRRFGRRGRCCGGRLLLFVDP